MKEIINPERLVSVPFSKTDCGVDFYINTATNKDIGPVLTEYKRFKTDFFSFYFLRKANGFLLLNFRKIELHDGMVLLLSPHQQQEWHVDEAALDYTFLIFREDFMRTFIADKFFVYRLLYYYQTDTPPYLYASPEELAEYMRLLGKIKQELLHPVADTYNLIVSVLYYLLLIINRAYAAAYRLPVEIAKNNLCRRIPPARRNREEQLRLPIQGLAGTAHPHHAAGTGVCRQASHQPHHAERFGHGSVRRISRPFAETTSVGRAEERTALLQPHRQRTGGRFPFLRPQPLNALLQTADREDVHAVFAGLPERDI